MNYVVSFQGGETSGSVAKRNLNSTFRRQNIIEQAPDKLSFKGKSEDNASSFGKGLIMTLAAAALIVGGLGYAHKADVVGKLKDGKVKDFLKKADKITEPCHKFCSKVKEFCQKYYEKIKEFFNKKG